MDRINDTTLDRTLGCMVGGAAGDALGYAVEFCSWSEIQRKYGHQGIREYRLDNRGVAEISDDTQMALFTANGILFAMTRGYTYGLMARIDHYCENTYIDWLHTQDWPLRKEKDYGISWLMDVPELYSRRAPGNTCLNALRAIDNGKPVENDSCGCGGVMRTAPIALFSYIHNYLSDFEDNLLACDDCAAGAAKITHKHPLGFMPSAVLNHILMRIMDGACEAPDGLVSVVRESLSALPNIKSEDNSGRTYGMLFPKHVKQLQDIVEQAISLAGTDSPDPVAIESIGGGWTGHEALAIALYSAVKHSDSFEDAIISAVNHSGDSDSTGAVCGNIMGCLLGRKSIPKKFIEHLELREVIEEISHDLWTGCIIDDHNHCDSAEQRKWFLKYEAHRWKEPEPSKN